MRIEAARQAVADLPITPASSASLRQTARLKATHYSTMIEGNRLTQAEVARVIESEERVAGRERDEKEVLGYFAGLDHIEKLARRGDAITEADVKSLHAIVMSGGGKRTKPTPYRDGQNVIRDGRTRAIVYMPPEAKDVPVMMRELMKWIAASDRDEVPCPIRAALAHYQFATIHPYYDGNGRTARLLTTLILHLGGYDLKGLYSLEEYYAQNLADYYAAISVGPSHNYYMGRADADVTAWIDYFCAGMAESFESVKRRALLAAKEGAKDKSAPMRTLDVRQRRVVELFQQNDTITSRDIALLLSLTDRTARQLCTTWTNAGFLAVANPARKNRTYTLGRRFRAILG